MRHKVLELPDTACPEDLHFYGTLQPAGDPNPSRVKPSSRAEKMQQNSYTGFEFAAVHATTSSTWYPFFSGHFSLLVSRILLMNWRVPGCLTLEFGPYAEADAPQGPRNAKPSMP